MNHDQNIFTQKPYPTSINKYPYLTGEESLKIGEELVESSSQMYVKSHYLGIKKPQ